MGRSLVEEALLDFSNEERAAIRKSFAALVAGRLDALGADLEAASRLSGLPVSVLAEILAGEFVLTYPMLKTVQQAFFPGSSPSALFRLSLPQQHSPAAELLANLLGYLDEMGNA